MENVAKNLHLFDEYFMKIKAEKQMNEQLNMINMFKSKASIQNDNFANLFSGFPRNNNLENEKRKNTPECFEYFGELNKSTCRIELYFNFIRVARSQ